MSLDLGAFIACQKMIAGVDSFSLLAVPFFILTGVLMNSGGIAHKLINFAKVLVGKMPGGLAQTNIVGNAIFGSISGSAVAATIAVGGVMIPMEEKEGYDKKFASAANIASAPAGLIIPPSGILIIYPVLVGCSVVGMIMSGYIPGLMWALACMIVTFIIAKKHNYYSESTGLPEVIGEAMLSLSDNKYVILLLINVILLIVGTFMDITPAVLIFAPIFLPVVESFGMHPIHFGIMMVMNLGIGNITPPVGSSLFAGCSVANIPIEKMMKPIVPFYIALFIAVLLVAYVPWFSMVVPEMVGAV